MSGSQVSKRSPRGTAGPCRESPTKENLRRVAGRGRGNKEGESLQVKKADPVVVLYGQIVYSERNAGGRQS